MIRSKLSFGHEEAPAAIAAGISELLQLREGCGEELGCLPTKHLHVRARGLLSGPSTLLYAWVEHAPFSSRNPRLSYIFPLGRQGCRVASARAHLECLSACALSPTSGLGVTLYCHLSAPGVSSEKEPQLDPAHSLPCGCGWHHLEACALCRDKRTKPKPLCLENKGRKEDELQLEAWARAERL